MKFIEFDKTLCDNCFKCLRACPTKAISFNKEERKIMDHLCIKCGRCLAKCPQDALKIKNPIEQIKSDLSSGVSYAVSLAPSFIGAFQLTSPGQMVTGLKKLGFSLIEETAVGAEIVSMNYERLIAEKTGQQMVTSCCPSANYMIEYLYPELIPFILPVVSPMIAHGLYIKQRHESIKVLFIGPCLAKMAEAEEITGAIDAVITFDELSRWFEEEEIILKELATKKFDLAGSRRGRGFPLGTDFVNEQGKARSEHHFKQISGMHQCRSLCEELIQNPIEGYVFELNICEGSCNNGPDFPKNAHQRYHREKLMEAYRLDLDTDYGPSIRLDGNEVEVKRIFSHRKDIRKTPNHNEIKEILRQMGKYTTHDELNCGACGYVDCQEKAQAVFYGYSDVHECLAYLRGKAENMHSVLIDNSPNAVCTIDNKLTIIEINPTFDAIFNDTDVKTVGLPIETFIEEKLFVEALNKRVSVKSKRIYVPSVQRHFITNIIYHGGDDVLLCFFTDITPIEAKKKALEQVKKETLLKTQEVIDKQMRVAQEIASLLGETTAETKMSLNSLKSLVLRDQGGLLDDIEE
ncbi:conserved protein of unknown function [Petrocella atlantisensis]|uniref:Hydrogenase n=1 Tax=Petrocella atlantisensis TaxID=2173034 RepID=A0A3P7PAD3_9FIRM|nr:[Fe-Fe] hydrogenase large subunit C-terminal domain-containing protein [Petrocella atlantisensis]VDN47123.1 conserved protein of unknown function [Petrocella atlantisensis]